MDSDQIILELTGPLERAVGKTELCLPAAGNQMLGAVLAALITEYPAATSVLGEAGRYSAAEGDLPPGLLVVRDSAAIHARLETPVCAGERLTLMPMISGG